MSTNAVKNARFGTLACAVAVLTIFVLVGNVGILIHRLLNSGFMEAQVQRSVTSRSPESSAPVLAKAAKPANSVLEIKAVSPKESQLQRIETQAEAQEVPARTVSARARGTSYIPLAAEPPLHDFLGRTMITAAAIIAAGIIAPIIFAISLFGLLRRHSQRFGPLIRVEYAGLPPMLAGPAPVGESVSGASENHDRLADGQAPSTNAQVAQPFDLGATFAQERVLKEQQVGRQEEAVLQQLFDNNLALYEQIDFAKKK